MALKFFRSSSQKTLQFLERADQKKRVGTIYVSDTNEKDSRPLPPQCIFPQSHNTIKQLQSCVGHQNNNI